MPQNFILDLVTIYLESKFYLELILTFLPDFPAAPNSFRGPLQTIPGRPFSYLDSGYHFTQLQGQSLKNLGVKARKLCKVFSDNYETT